MILHRKFSISGSELSGMRVKLLPKEEGRPFSQAELLPYIGTPSSSETDSYILEDETYSNKVAQQAIAKISHLFFYLKLLEAIKESGSILNLEHDWDGEGSSTYDESTWIRATNFLKTNALSLSNNSGLHIPIPEIDPGPHGSIDLHWRTRSRELLINIPHDPNQLAGYYGDNFADEKIKGKLNTSEENVWIMMWLMK